MSNVAKVFPNAANYLAASIKDQK